MNPQEDLGVGDTWILFPRSDNRCIRLLPTPQKTTVFLMGHYMKQYILVRVKLDKKYSGIHMFQEVT